MIELAVICGLLVALHAWTTVDRRRERQEVRAERADLLQRIQAPQAAVIQHHNGNTPVFAPPAVNPDLDEDHWLSKDDLAELVGREEQG